MHSALIWIQANPVLFSVVLWPFITAIFTQLFKPRTAAEYAAMNPRVAAVLRGIGALGIDAPKLLESLRLVVTGGLPAGAPAVTTTKTETTVVGPTPDAAPTEPVLPKDPQ